MQLWRDVWAADKRAGALVALEVGEGLNVHLHVLLYGRAIHQAELSRKWREYTGSYIVWIERVRSVEEGVREVIKYLMKPVKTDVEHDTLVKVMKALKGVRRYWQKGSFYCLRVVGRTTYRCCYCMSDQVVVDFPWREIHSLGSPPLAFREFRFSLPKSWYSKGG
jgi:hypothetical protein